MNFKIILGIIIPSIIIVVLTILASLNIGFSIEKDFIKELNFDDLFTEDYQLRNSIKIADITLTNNYFLSKRYELPKFGICFRDRERNFPQINAGTLKYSEGGYSYETGELDSRVYNDYYPNRAQTQNINIKSNSKKSIIIFFEPSYELKYKNYSVLFEAYKEYDELIILELKNSGDYYCENFNQENIKGEIIIPINLRGTPAKNPNSPITNHFGEKQE